MLALLRDVLVGNKRVPGIVWYARGADVARSGPHPSAYAAKQALVLREKYPSGVERLPEDFAVWPEPSEDKGDTTGKKPTRDLWFAENGADEWQVWHEAGMACIATVHRGVEPDSSGEANARLIAASPHLLAVVEDAYRTAGQMGWIDKMLMWGAAIEKAGGKR